MIASSKQLGVLAALLFVSAGCSSWFSGEVDHPEPGAPSSVESCAAVGSDENTCSHCASKPGCGFCAAPTNGAVQCQPGTAQDRAPSSCSVELTIDPSTCAAPPPPLP